MDRAGFGSTSLTTGDGGGVVARQLYHPYGTVRWSEGTLPTDFGFTGQRGVPGTGLIFMHARYYHPYLNRFISADTIVPEPENPQDLSRYSYVRNRPLNGVDPDGHVCFFGIGSCDDEEDIGKKAALAVIKPIARTWSNATTTVNTAKAVLFGNPLGAYRSVLPEGTTDLTRWLLEEMQANARGDIAQTLHKANQGGVDGQYAALMGWTALVKGDGPWDFKDDLLEKGLQSVQLADKWYSFDVIANIHYGYVGMASGFSVDALLNGAGIAQIKAGTSDWSFFWSRFDDPADVAAILVGIYLWRHYGDQELTPEMLQEALHLYERYGDLRSEER